MLGVAQYYSHELADFTPADGYLGMGFRNLSNFDANPVFQTLLAQHAITAPVFSFKFAGPNPDLLLGGIDNDMYQFPITYMPVTNEVVYLSTALSTVVPLHVLNRVIRVSGRSHWVLYTLTA